MHLSTYSGIDWILSWSGVKRINLGPISKTAWINRTSKLQWQHNWVKTIWTWFLVELHLTLPKQWFNYYVAPTLKKRLGQRSGLLCPSIRLLKRKVNSGLSSLFYLSRNLLLTFQSLLLCLELLASSGNVFWFTMRKKSKIQNWTVRESNHFQSPSGVTATKYYAVPHKEDLNYKFFSLWFTRLPPKYAAGRDI